MQFRALAPIVLCLAALSFASCRTRDDDSAAREIGDATVDNGRLAPRAIVIQYASIGAGIDQATKAAVDAVLADAEGADELSDRVNKVWGKEGELTDCAEFEDFGAVEAYRQKICHLIKDGNAKAGAELTVHQLAMSCTADLLGPLSGNDQGC